MRNVLRWNCGEHGCFNQKCRLKFHVFRGVFPRNINFTDVDGMVEIGGAFCLLEWKDKQGVLQFAQFRAFQEFTTQSEKNAVFVVQGNAETMEITGYQLLWRGVLQPFKPATLEQLKKRLQRWAEWVSQRPKLSNENGHFSIRAAR